MEATYRTFVKIEPTTSFMMHYHTNPSQLKKGQTYEITVALLNPKFHIPMYKIKSCPKLGQDNINFEWGTTNFKIF